MLRAVIVFAYLVTALATRSAGAAAQAPGWAAIDAAFGGGNGRGGEYTARARTVWRLSAQGRLASVAGVTILASIDRERYFMGGDRVDLCLVGSRGQCVPEFPEFSGWTGGLGIRTAFGRIAITGLAGPARYHSTDGAARQLPDDASSGSTVHADVALRTWRKVWLTAAIRRTDLRAIRGDHLRLTSIGVGLRAN